MVANTYAKKFQSKNQHKKDDVVFMNPRWGSTSLSVTTSEEENEGEITSKQDFERSSVRRETKNKLKTVSLLFNSEFWCVLLQTFIPLQGGYTIIRLLFQSFTILCKPKNALIY